MRLRTLVATGLGYALGTRAGEKRYEDMQRLYHDVVESDTFAQVVQRGKETLGEGVRMVTGTTPGWASGDEAEAEGVPGADDLGESREGEGEPEEPEDPGGGTAGGDYTEGSRSDTEGGGEQTT